MGLDRSRWGGVGAPGMATSHGTSTCGRPVTVLPAWLSLWQLHSHGALSMATSHGAPATARPLVVRKPHTARAPAELRCGIAVAAVLGRRPSRATGCIPVKSTWRVRVSAAADPRLGPLLVASGATFTTAGIAGMMCGWKFFDVWLKGFGHSREGPRQRLCSESNMHASAIAVCHAAALNRARISWASRRARSVEELQGLPVRETERI